MTKDTICVTGPVFERPSTWAAVQPPPTTRAEWEGLRGETREQLLARGCSPWDDSLMLFPRDWYSAIPEGYELKCISGKVEKFRLGKTDDDQRWGALAFGVESTS
jgi:hypothetical protein